jgi:WhiB family redox-sensing transcriptional regulator
MSIQIQIQIMVETVHHEPPLWQRHAKCLGYDPDFFYPSEGGAGGVTAAKRVCKGEDGAPVCPVKKECLAHALNHDERFGVWGGTSERERRRLRKTWVKPSGR